MLGLYVFKKILSNRSVVILLISLFYCMLDGLIPEQFGRFLYACSMFLKDIIVLVIPLCLIFFIAHTVKSFGSMASLFVLSIVVFEFFSNFLAVNYAYICSKLVGIGHINCQNYHQADFTPLFRLSFEKPWFWSADKAVLFGSVLALFTVFINNFIQKSLRCLNAEEMKGWETQSYEQIGVLCAKMRLTGGKQSLDFGGLFLLRTVFFINYFLSKGKDFSNFLLLKIFTKFIPVFIIGFFISIYKKGLIKILFMDYLGLIFVTTVVVAFYFLILLAIASKFCIIKAKTLISHMGSAFFFALSSGCSLSTMPLTIAGTSKSCVNAAMAEAVIPATTNVQQIADCIIHIFLVNLLYFSFFGSTIEFFIWVKFSLIFVFTRFATVGILGGAFFLVAPLYERYLNFSPEMIGLMLTFNIILDPIVTCFNVMCNSMLCIIFERCWLKLQALNFKKIFRFRS